MIPAFEKELVGPGYHVLPSGIHQATMDEVTARFGQSRHRRELLAGMIKGLEALRAAGCPRVFLDGSFVTSKARPDDYDAAWDPTGVVVGALDPVFLDPTTRVPDRQGMKRKFGGEFFPSTAEARPGRNFVDFFQDVKFEPGKRKGILVLSLEVK